MSILIKNQPFCSFGREVNLAEMTDISPAGNLVTDTTLTGNGSSASPLSVNVSRPLLAVGKGMGGVGTQADPLVCTPWDANFTPGVFSITSSTGVPVLNIPVYIRPSDGLLYFFSQRNTSTTNNLLVILNIARTGIDYSYSITFSGNRVKFSFPNVASLINRSISFSGSFEGSLQSGDFFIIIDQDNDECRLSENIPIGAVIDMAADSFPYSLY